MFVEHFSDCVLYIIFNGKLSNNPSVINLLSSCRRFLFLTASPVLFNSLLNKCLQVEYFRLLWNPSQEHHGTKKFHMWLRADFVLTQTVNPCSLSVRVVWNFFIKGDVSSVTIRQPRLRLCGLNLNKNKVDYFIYSIVMFSS